MKDYIIVGAGLSGLNAAKSIQEKKLGSVLVLEKSRGVGGRMATRRTLGTRFDHGAQFYRLKNDIVSLHQTWSEQSINKKWFMGNNLEHWCAREGMTSLPKSVAKDLDIQLEKLIYSIEFNNGVWTLKSDKNEMWECRHLTLSAPLPQSVAIIERSNLKSMKVNELITLKNILYTKALIGLVVLQDPLPLNTYGYLEYENSDFFSIAGQKEKGISELNAYTLTMSPAFSELSFEQSDEVNLDKILKALIAQYPNAVVIDSELKKWRYCQPHSIYKSYFLEISSNLFLIGDSFGGSSLKGAIRSSAALIEKLSQ